MKKIIYFILLSFLILSCKKEYHVSGRVYNPINGNGLAGVEVRFVTSDWGGGIGSGDKKVTSTLTDANGYYDLKYKGVAERVKPDPYDLYLLGNFYEGSYQTAMRLEGGKNQNIDWHAVPFGEFNTHIQNVNCVSSSDSMQLRNKYQFDNNFDSWGFIYHVGCYNYTSSQVSKVPMGFYYYETKVIRSGVTTYVYDTVFVTENGISNLEILY